MNEQQALDLQLDAYRFAQRPEVRDRHHWHRTLNGNQAGRGLVDPAELDDCWAWVQALWQFPLVLIGAEIQPVMVANLHRFTGLHVHAEDVPLDDGLVLLHSTLPPEWANITRSDAGEQVAGFAWQRTPVEIGTREVAGYQLVWVSESLTPDLACERQAFGVRTPDQVRPTTALPLMAMATWAMMRDYLVAAPAVPRQNRRRAARAGAPEQQPVRWVTLRRRRPSSKATGTADVAWRHQWLVSGHWRRQWYPSVGEHRPRWIAPYLKGPDGAPMLERETDYRLIR